MLDMKLYPYEGRRPRVYKPIRMYRRVKVPIHAHVRSGEILLSLLSSYILDSHVDARNLCCSSLLYSCSELLTLPKDERIIFN